MSHLHLYRGLKATLLIYRHTEIVAGRARNDDLGFDAAVRIRERLTEASAPRSRVFRLNVGVPFGIVGSARHASKLYAEKLIEASAPSLRASIPMHGAIGDCSGVTDES
jgi:hypothetical protein